ITQRRKSLQYLDTLLDLRTVIVEAVSQRRPQQRAKSLYITCGQRHHEWQCLPQRIVVTARQLAPPAQLFQVSKQPIQPLGDLLPYGLIEYKRALYASPAEAHLHSGRLDEARQPRHVPSKLERHLLDTRLLSR